MHPSHTFCTCNNTWQFLVTTPLAYTPSLRAAKTWGALNLVLMSLFPVYSNALMTKMSNKWRKNSGRVMKSRYNSEFEMFRENETEQFLVCVTEWSGRSLWAASKTMWRYIVPSSALLVSCMGPSTLTITVNPAFIGNIPRFPDYRLVTNVKLSVVFMNESCSTRNRKVIARF